MHRLVITCVGLALLLAAGCADGTNRAGSTADASPSPSPTPTAWAEVTHAAGKLESLAYGRASLGFTTTGGPVRIMVGFGPAPAWGVKVARFRYELYRGGTADKAVTPVVLETLSTTTTPWTGSRYQLLGRDDLAADTYTLLFWGAGWYGVTVYLPK